MSYEVILSPQATDDLVEIYFHVASHDVEGKAERLIARLEKICSDLAVLPRRGHGLPELEAIGRREFPEVYFKPYRIIYQVDGKVVMVHGILDGRRSLSEVLSLRLLHP